MYRLRVAICVHSSEMSPMICVARITIGDGSALCNSIALSILLRPARVFSVR